MTNISPKQLIEIAFKAREQAYAPYSGFSVGAALLCKNGQVFCGCNVENAAYTATICAEQTAIAKAVSEGNQEFIALALCGGMKDNKEEELDYVYPCGICRQVLSEFALADFKVYAAISVSDFQVISLDELLPKAFSLKHQV
jgi:cytidine deaminase